MTQNIRITDIQEDQSQDPRRPVSRELRLQPWMIALGLAILAALAYITPPYLALDPNQATVPLPPEVPEKYPLVVLHILFGTVAMVAGFFQFLPWLRRTHPKIHRMTGRVYVFLGVLPSVLLAWYLLTTFGGPGWAGRFALSILWFVTTAVAFVHARQGRMAEHRVYMFYSFALTMEAFTTRLLLNVILLVLGMPLGEIPDGTDPRFTLETGEMVAWFGWSLNLAITTWWLQRRPRRRAKVDAATTAG